MAWAKASCASRVIAAHFVRGCKVQPVMRRTRIDRHRFPVGRDGLGDIQIRKIRLPQLPDAIPSGPIAGRHRYATQHRCKVSGFKPVACQPQDARLPDQNSRDGNSHQRQGAPTPAIERDLHRIVICYERWPVCKLYLVGVKERGMPAACVWPAQILAVRIPATIKLRRWPATQVTLRKPFEPTLDPREPASSCPCARPAPVCRLGKA